MADWQSIVALHKDLVWRTTYRLVGNHADAADCMQEAFVGALEISRRQRVRHWPALLVRLATHRSLDLLRRRMRLVGRYESPPDWNDVAGSAAAPFDRLAESEWSERLRQSLAHLPEAQAEAFCLRYVSELSYRQIARQMDLKSSAVGVLLHRARKQLRVRLSGSEMDAKCEVEVSP